MIQSFRRSMRRGIKRGLWRGGYLSWKMNESLVWNNMLAFPSTLPDSSHKWAYLNLQAFAFTSMKLVGRFLKCGSTDKPDIIHVLFFKCVLPSSIHLYHTDHSRAIYTKHTGHPTCLSSSPLSWLPEVSDPQGVTAAEAGWRVAQLSVLPHKQEPQMPY